MIIKDLDGRDFEILNLNEFKNHILKYHVKIAYLWYYS